MPDQTIKPVSPVSKTSNSLKNGKSTDKNKPATADKPKKDNSAKKKGGIDTYA